MSTINVKVECDLPAIMRDGTILRANVFRPDTDGQFPTLLTRTPYNKSDLAKWVWSGLDPIATAAEGFVVIIQDVRGRFASGGEWVPFVFEGSDGADTIRWAASLPFSSGHVGMFSASYCGNLQYLAAQERPSELAAISPAMTWHDPYDGFLSRGGAVEWGLALRWSLENGFDDIDRMAVPEDDRQGRRLALAREWDDLDTKGYWDLPVSEAPAIRRHDLTDLGIIRSLSDPDVANHCDVSNISESLRVPSLHTAGWYDIFQQGTLDNYERAAAAGRDARLVIGPWSHQTFADPIGTRAFGMHAGRTESNAFPEGDWSDYQLEWFRAYLGADTEVKDFGPPVRLFVMGANVWREEQEWPLARAKTVSWFLHADGTLSPEKPVDEGHLEFVYDPRNPVPTCGGNGVLSPAHATGPLDQSTIEMRGDVLRFTSAPLAEEIEVTGPVRVTVHAASSAVSTDWVARLCDVFPDGRSINLCDGILRVTKDAQTPNSHTIELWSTSNLFRKGHRLRVHVTSSSFPRWDRNLNTGDQSSTRMEVAKQSVRCGGAHPSFIDLPIIP